jgi:hypothetical protein
MSMPPSEAELWAAVGRSLGVTGAALFPSAGFGMDWCQFPTSIPL